MVLSVGFVLFAVACSLLGVSWVSLEERYAYSGFCGLRPRGSLFLRASKPTDHWNWCALLSEACSRKKSAR